MKTKKFLKWFVPILLLSCLLFWLQYIRYFSPHYWYGKERVTLIFEALQREDYETAWKHWDPKKEVSVSWVKEFLQDINVSKVNTFEIVCIEIDDYKRENDPWVTVYVKINNKKIPDALHVEYDELILYAGHNRYLDY